jgi:hypothetical protein
VKLVTPYLSPLLTDHDVSRFWAYVDQVDDDDSCWLWSGPIKTGPMPYGLLTLANDGSRRITMLAHRLSYYLHAGELRTDLCVMHRCDNPPCVRPSHLVMGTSRQNTHDAAAKRRLGGWCKPKLTIEQVREIRAARATGERLAVLGSRYGVTAEAVYAVCVGRSHSYVA